MNYPLFIFCILNRDDRVFYRSQSLLVPLLYPVDLSGLSQLVVIHCSYGFVKKRRTTRAVVCGDRFWLLMLSPSEAAILAPCRLVLGAFFSHRPKHRPVAVAIQPLQVIVVIWTIVWFQDNLRLIVCRLLEPSLYLYWLAAWGFAKPCCWKLLTWATLLRMSKLCRALPFSHLWDLVSGLLHLEKVQWGLHREVKMQSIITVELFA